MLRVRFCAVPLRGAAQVELGSLNHLCVFLTMGCSCLPNLALRKDSGRSALWLPPAVLVPGESSPTFIRDF